MTARPRPAAIVLARWFSLLVFAPVLAVALQAGDLNLQAMLVWGTNEEKPANKDLKELPPDLLKKLRGVFKWKNYFEVNRQKVSLPPKNAKRARLSDKCEVEVENFGGSDIEVRVIGRGKLFGKVRETIS